MKKTSLMLSLTLPIVAFAGRTGPWTKEQAWGWYDKQPWIRGCNYMPASAANRVDQWQALGSEERFAEVERELALAEEIGFNGMGGAYAALIASFTRDGKVNDGG